MVEYVEIDRIPNSRSKSKKLSRCLRAKIVDEAKV